MRIDFQQGIVTHPVTGSSQLFLAKTGSYVSLQTANGRTDIAFSHGTDNYLLTEAEDVPNAWGPLAGSTNYWLYWNIDLRTAVRTFGFTTVAPIVSSAAPSPIPDQHWFDSSVKKMYVYQSGGWREVIRCFAAMVNNSTFTSLSTGVGTRLFAGTQVGLTTANVAIGRIVFDDLGKPIRQSSGRFFTTESDFFANGSPVNTIRLEANVIFASAGENMGQFHVVKYVDFGNIMLANYDDTGTTLVAMLMEDVVTNEVATVVMQGVVSNPSWNWPTVGVQLWIATNGTLTSTDPHLSDPITYPIGRVPVARVISPTSVFFDQGLGQKGDKGEVGDAGGVLATSVVAGVTRLSVNAVDPAIPIAAGTNDPRIVNAVSRAGDTMTGPLVLPTNGLSVGSQLTVSSGQLTVTLPTVHTKVVTTTPVTLTDASSIVTNASLSNTFVVTLGGNRILSNPTNLVDGCILNYYIKQDNIGGRTLSYDSLFKWPGGIVPIITTAPNALCAIVVQYIQSLNILVCNMIQDIK